METKSGPVFVLTGAGYTKNFGGFLATEMWSQIFNDRRVQASSNLRAILQRDFNYESAYSDAIDSSLPDADKQVMKDVVLQAYRRLDDTIRGWVFNDDSPYPVNRYGLSDLFSHVFQAGHGKQGFFFTLNQDLFMERQWGSISPAAPRFFTNMNFSGSALETNSFAELPRDGVQEKVKKAMADHAGQHYIKLHGSYGWKSSDGASQIVVGTNKESLIQNEPLLQEYFSIFQSTIREGSKKVLIIGYGFKDEHINKELLEGVTKHGLELYVISTQNPKDLSDQMQQDHNHTDGILDGLRGYYPYQLKEIFPGNQERTVHIDQILESLGI